MRLILFLLIVFNFSHSSYSQSYITTLDTFYVQTPEYSTSIGIDSLHFPGAITTPDLGSKFPILIMVHGTAALDMNSSSTKDYLDSIGASYRKAETYMFSEIADSLSRNGIMVFRYDKRSFTLNCIEKSDCWYVDTVSPYDYIKDIHNAIDFVKTLPKVDTCNIFLAGHSQGGSFVSKVGYDRSDIQGVLNMAGTATPIDSVSIYQSEVINSDPLGADILRDQFDSLRNGTWPINDTLYNNHFSPRFWLDWISHTDSAVIVQKNSTTATALMYATADRFVPSNIHYQIWQDSVTRSNATFKLFTDIDHSFGTEFDSTISPQVLDFMINWIHATSQNCSISSVKSIIATENFKIYPNPTQNAFTIELDKLVGSKYCVIDLNGKIIVKGIISKNGVTLVDVSALSSGVFVLKVGDFAKKLIIK